LGHESVTKCLGLVNQFNPLTMQQGSLAKANNCVIQRENVIEDRRGYAVDATLSANIKQLLQYSGKVLAHQGTTISYGPSTYNNYSGSYSEPTDSRIRAQEANSNLYFTTSLGVKVFTDTTGTAARSAGVPRSLDPSYALNAAGSGFLSNTSQCAYRVVLSRTDANSNVLTGYPSQRLWVSNSSGSSKNIDLTVYLPSEAQANDIVQFYRTAQVSGVASDTSGDEMALVYQLTLTSADITAGFITFTDSITDALRGATLYTSPSQQGIAQANDRPPLCKDISLFRSSYMFFGNCSTKQRLYLTLVGTSGLSGKSITLGGVTYEFGASEITSGAGSPQAEVSATGVLAVDIDLTARSFVRVINRYALNTAVYAYYLTGPDDLPGQIMIEEKGIGASAFTVQSEDTGIQAMFFPPPPVAPATDTKSTSSNSVQRNAVYFSKFQEFEHVPALNYILVGPSNKSILRIVALRESLVIIKEEGVYRLTGETTQSFSVTPLDLTVFCKSADSVAVVSNQVFMLSNQGVVSISETGVSVVSHEIEPTIKKVIQNANVDDYSFGCGYESDRHYILSCPTTSASTAPDQTLVYNVFTRAWVKWTYAFKTAVVEPISDKMYFGKPSDVKVYVERKDGSNTDYSDPESSITITAISGDDISFTVSGITPEAGWIISQGGIGIRIDELTTMPGAYVATMADTPPSSFAAGAATLYPSVGLDIEWNPWFAGQPALLKQVRAIKILSDSTEGETSSTYLEATFRSNFDEDEEAVRLSPNGSGFGTGLWGSDPWGGGSDPYGYPSWVPRNKQYCTRLYVGVQHKAAQEKVAICGCAYDFEMNSDRIGI
jgi:hypothetical protein